MVLRCGSEIDWFQNDALAGIEFHTALACSKVFRPPRCSLQYHCENVAKPSLSQMLLQSCTETLSPNHWCDNSCAIVIGSGAKPYSGRVCVSSEKPTFGTLSTMAPVDVNAYAPKRC